jgi:antitoxin (DNA-binding transcriptional repressor) of toxin-antitoxin stability system
LDNINTKLYNITKHEQGVMKLVPVAAPLKQEIEKNHSAGKAAMDIRKKRGVRTLAGKRLTEISKEGK